MVVSCCFALASLCTATSFCTLLPFLPEVELLFTTNSHVLHARTHAPPLPVHLQARQVCCTQRMLKPVHRGSLRRCSPLLPDLLLLTRWKAAQQAPHHVLGPLHQLLRRHVQRIACSQCLMPRGRIASIEDEYRCLYIQTLTSGLPRVMNGHQFAGKYLDLDADSAVNYAVGP